MNEETAAVTTKKTAAQRLRGWIGYIAIILSVVMVFLIFGIRVVNVDGASMDTTLVSGEKIVITNFFYTPQDGDIIVVSRGAHYDKRIVKRVIATEGQSVKLDYANNKIYVDGKELDEPYVKDGTTFGGNFGNYAIPEVVPEGKIFVMGDNRSVSLDSRSSQIGLVNTSDVMGKAQFAIFPFDRFGAIG